MAHDIVKFDRGQVWVIRFKYPEQKGHEIQKDRPWLVISVGNFNESSGMLTAVPITTRDSTVSPAQVLFYNRGNRNVILCEQIRSFDYRSGSYVFDYMGTLSDEILEKVDVALSVHTGLHYSPITLKNLYSTMESIIKSVSYMQEKDSTPKFTEQDIQEFTERLKSSSITEHEEEKVEEDNVTEEEEITEQPKRKNKRFRWTEEMKEEFKSDLQSMSTVDMMQKWNITDKSRFYSMKHYVMKNS